MSMSIEEQIIYAIDYGYNTCQKLRDSHPHIEPRKISAALQNLKNQKKLRCDDRVWSRT